MFAFNPSLRLIKTEAILEKIFADNLHKKRQLSLAYGAMGVLGSSSLFLHEIGRGMAKTRNKNKKHATKQIDRLLSNKGISIWDLSAQWVPYLIGSLNKILVALDWTAFAGDKQYMLSLNLVTSKGVSAPLLWKTVDKALMKHNRARYEDQILSRLKEVLPADVRVTLLADRGFADQKFFRFLDEELHFHYIIRIRANTIITYKDESQHAQKHVRKDGYAVQLKQAEITLQQYEVKQVVIVQDKGMKAPWVLVSNADMKTREVVNCYSKRWKIEPYFRDLKDGRFGYGLRETHILASGRRDRLMLIVALSYTLLLQLGQAGEQIGFDKKLKVNTVKTRTHSLFRQGQNYYEDFASFTEEEQDKLLEEFEKILSNQPFWCDFFGSEK